MKLRVKDLYEHIVNEVIIIELDNGKPNSEVFALEDECPITYVNENGDDLVDVYGDNRVLCIHGFDYGVKFLLGNEIGLE